MIYGWSGQPEVKPTILSPEVFADLFVSKRAKKPPGHATSRSALPIGCSRCLSCPKVVAPTVTERGKERIQQPISTVEQPDWLIQ